MEYWGFLVLTATCRNFFKKRYLFCHVLLEWKAAIPGEEEMIGTYQVVWSTLFRLCDVFLGVVKFNVQLHAPSGSMEQVWCELL